MILSISKRRPLFVASLVFLCSAVASRAQTSLISVEVAASSKSAIDAKDKFKKTAKRSLKITVRNGGTQDANLKIKYAFFGHGVRSHDLISLDSAELESHPKAHNTDVVETRMTNIVFSEAHVDKKKKVEASGDRIVGWGVQVFDAGKLVAEAYDPQQMKANMSGENKETVKTAAPQ